MNRTYELREIANGWLVRGGDSCILIRDDPRKPLEEQHVSSLGEALELIRRHAKGDK